MTNRLTTCVPVPRYFNGLGLRNCKKNTGENITFNEWIDENGDPWIDENGNNWIN